MAKTLKKKTYRKKTYRKKPHTKKAKKQLKRKTYRKRGGTKRSREEEETEDEEEEEEEERPVKKSRMDLQRQIREQIREYKAKLTRHDNEDSQFLDNQRGELSPEETKDIVNLLEDLAETYSLRDEPANQMEYFDMDTQGNMYGPDWGQRKVIERNKIKDKLRDYGYDLRKIE